MAIAGRRNDLTTILAEQMRNSCVDCHYTAKYWVRFNPNDATKPQGLPNDDTWYSNAVTRPLARLLLLPVWLPHWYWKKRKKKNEMREFVVAGTSGRKLHDVLDSALTEEELSYIGDVLNKEPDTVREETQAASQLAFNKLMRQLALEWVGLHPGDFIFGEHDPKVAKLQTTFETILGEST